MRLPHLFLPALLLLATASAFAANTAPTPTIISAAMRPGTTLMDVIYRVTDPDDATVRVRALAFVNGTRSFANILRPVTFVEGTSANLGDSIPSNTNQVLTWNVGADWNIDLGQVKFEILALDSRGLLPIDWITIPAANGQPAVGPISKDTPSDASILNALFWLYADNDPGLALTNGVLSGTDQSGAFSGVQLASASKVADYGTPFCFKRMNLDVATAAEVNYASTSARSGLLNPLNWHAANRVWQGISVLVAWGNNGDGQTTIPNIPLLSSVTAIACGGRYSMALKSDGTVVAWGSNSAGQTTVPAGLNNATKITASLNTSAPHSIALKSDETAAAWGSDAFTKATIPIGLSGVIAIGAGGNHSVALKSDGTIVAWGDNSVGQTNIPQGLSSVIAIAIGGDHSLALRSDGTVVAWGKNSVGQTTVPAGLSGVTAIAAGGGHSMALKSDGTVVSWGSNSAGQRTTPVGLSGVRSIAAGEAHSMAIQSDGTVVAWGTNTFGQLNIPLRLSGVTAISAGTLHSLALKAKAP